MKEAGITGVMFDWDGVLLDSLGTNLRVYNRMLATVGMKPLTRERFFALQSPNYYEFYSNLGIPRDRWKEMDDSWQRFYREESPGLQPDAIHCLNSLKRSGFRLALVSNGSKARVERELEKFGLRVFVDPVLCGERAEELKPSPRMIVKALEILRLQPKSAAYVGDTPADMQASKGAGTVSVAIAREPVLAARLVKEAPDYIFSNLAEMTDMFVNGERGAPER